jgi:hypothetical protein
MVAVGLVITFVGLGDKGFKSIELQLVGPSLVGCGLIFALLQILYCTLPSFGKSCCAQNEDSEKLLRNEELLVDYQIKNNYQINGVVKPSRNVVGDNSANFVNVIPESDEMVDNLRPILKTARNNSMNGGPDNRSRQDWREEFSFSSPLSSFGDGVVKLAPRNPHLEGSTKNLRNGDIILNSRRLFGDKEFFGDLK